VKHAVPFAIVAVLNLPVAAHAEDAVDLDDGNNRINYTLGYQIGDDFKRQGVDIDAEAMLQGIQDAAAGADPRLSAAEMQTTLVELRQSLAAEQQRQKAEQERELLAEGEAFLEENAKKEGVVTTESGLQYKMIEDGSGRTPAPTDKVTVHYTGTLIDGTEFDSSHKRGKPATFGLNAVIKGWTEGLQLMKEGGKAQLFIPPELAYGDRGRLAHRTLIFDVELISVGDEQPAEAPAEDDSAGEG
jgi:FKBP-type peptidyl-prolyl cis-trans isomerase